MNAFLSITSQRVFLILGMLLISGCLGHYQQLPPLNTSHTQHGMASWYGPSFHGKLSASGEPYDMWALTAAHRTLPFGTWVQVKKVATGKTVTVRINDRGPFIKGRIIDLSYAAARKLVMIGEGTAKVTLRILNTQDTASLSKTPNTSFWVQAGAFTMLTDALTFQERLAREYSSVRIQTVNLPSGEWHRVQIGSFHSKKTAQTVARALKKELGIEAHLLTSK